MDVSMQQHLFSKKSKNFFAEKSNLTG